MPSTAQYTMAMRIVQETCADDPAVGRILASLERARLRVDPQTRKERYAPVAAANEAVRLATVRYDHAIKAWREAWGRDLTPATMGAILSERDAAWSALAEARRAASLSLSTYRGGANAR